MSCHALQVHIQTIGILVAEKTELQSSLNQTQKSAESRQGNHGLPWDLCLSMIDKVITACLPWDLCLSMIDKVITACRETCGQKKRCLLVWHSMLLRHKWRLLWVLYTMTERCSVRRSPVWRKQQAFCVDKERLEMRWPGSWLASVTHITTYVTYPEQVEKDHIRWRTSVRTAVSWVGDHRSGWVVLWLI